MAFIDPMQWRREWAADERKRRWREMEQRFGKNMEKLGLGFKGGPEFEAAKTQYGKLGALEAPEDIGGISDLNAAERAALIEGQEGISSQLGEAEAEMRNLVGRMGGGGSEAAEAAERMRTSGIGMRAEEARAALLRGQQRVETRREQALQGWGTAGAGFGGLAQLREGAEQGATAERAAMLRAMLEGVGSGDMPYGPQQEGVFSAMYNAPMSRPFSAGTQATQLRNLYQPPTMYGGPASAYRRWGVGPGI